MNVPGKSPSAWRVVVTAGVFTVLASAVTPASAAPPVKRAHPAKKQPQAASQGGGGGSGGRAWLEWAITASLRP